MGYSEDDDDAGIVEEVVWLRDFEFNNDQVPPQTILLVGKRFSGKAFVNLDPPQSKMKPIKHVLN